MPSLIVRQQALETDKRAVTKKPHGASSTSLAVPNAFLFIEIEQVNWELLQTGLSQICVLVFVSESGNLCRDYAT